MKDVPTELPDGLVIAAMPAAGRPARRDRVRRGLRPRHAAAGRAGSARARCAAAAQLLRAAARPRDRGRARQPRHAHAQGRGRASSTPSSSPPPASPAWAGPTASPTTSTPTQMVSAVGQGAIGIEIRERRRRSCRRRARRLADPDTMACVTAERVVMRTLEGGCQVPIGAYARFERRAHAHGRRSSAASTARTIVRYAPRRHARPSRRRSARRWSTACSTWARARSSPTIRAAAEADVGRGQAHRDLGAARLATVMAGDQPARGLTCERSNEEDAVASPVVYLIGAGPGDPGLITVKGLECVAKADIVVYDYLANPRFLAAARPDAEVIYVGKKGFSKHVTQDEINALHRREGARGRRQGRRAPQGRRPVHLRPRRRGGAGAARQRHRASRSCPASAAATRLPRTPASRSRIAASPPTWRSSPATRTPPRRLATSTGRSWPRPSARSASSWASRTCPTIVEKLVEHGRPATTPVALVRWGTTPRQEVLTGTLADIVEKVAAAKFKAPAITIVGEVVKLREQLKWFEDKPLFGKTIVVTRSRTQASELTDKLVDLGAEVLEFPTIRIVDPESWQPLDEAIRNVDVYDWIVFTSVNGVDKFFERLHASATRRARAGATRRSPRSAPRPRRAASERGIVPDYVPGGVPRRGRARGLLRARRGRGHARAHPAGARGARGAAGHAARARRDRRRRARVPHGARHGREQRARSACPKGRSTW